MTLIVGGVEGSAVWMCADAAITDPTAKLRSRFYRPKVEAVGTSSLLGFAGSVSLGAATVLAIAGLEPGMKTVEALLETHIKNPGVEFLYGSIFEHTPQLFRIGNGRVDQASSLYIGDQRAYEKFQEIRLSRSDEHAPEAIHRLMVGAYRDNVVPDGLQAAISTMLAQFASTEDRGVGGWASPHMLTASGPSMCTYGYSVTDPITKSLATGQLIPHGTAERGGFSLSFCPLREQDGVVIYWLQKPGGKIFIRSGENYEEYDFSGSPEQFKAAVLEKLGRTVDVWFGDKPMGRPDSVEVMRDAEGEPRMFVARSGNELSFSWANNPNGSFHSSLNINLNEVSTRPHDDILENKGMKITVADDAETLHFSCAGNEANLTAEQADALISALALARMKLKKQVPSDIAQGSKLEAIIDPAWRTRPAPHPGLPGPLLALRHPGHGWQLFTLPRNEAKALGGWLTKHIADTEAGTTQE